MLDTKSDVNGLIIRFVFGSTLIFFDDYLRNLFNGLVLVNNLEHLAQQFIYHLLINNIAKKHNNVSD